MPVKVEALPVIQSVLGPRAESIIRPRSTRTEKGMCTMPVCAKAPSRRSVTMHIGKLAIVVIVLSALAGCATYYPMPRESEPHATLTFEKTKAGNGDRPTPRKLNGARPSYRRTLRIGVGTMRLELAEGGEGNLWMCGPRYTCELSFEAEAGRRYRVSMV